MTLMRSLRSLAGATLVAAFACAPSGVHPPGDAPSLVVVLVVDQLPPELLDRYDALFTRGLRRIRDEGFAFERGSHEHSGTYTAAGHFTLATGVHPSRHGIINNTWSVRQGDGWRSVYAVEDREATILGHPAMVGRSPMHALRDGLPTWILENDPRSRVVSLSAKDRSAIGLAGRARGDRVDVFWIADETGVFATSDYYRSRVPDWIVDFNRRIMPAVYSDTVWENRVPREVAHLSRPDTSRWELDGIHTAFPHRPSDVGDPSDPAAVNDWRFEYTPFPDRAVVELTMEAIRVLELGQRGSVDYLGISLSQTDRIGHGWGPGSREQLDNLLRLDAELGRLLTHLDEAVGRGRWVLAFSSDHGVLEIPEILAEQGVPARRLTRAERTDMLERIQRAVTAAEGADPGPAVRSELSGLAFVASAYSFQEIERGEHPDSFAVLYARSHSRDRATSLAARLGVYVRYVPNTLDFGAGRATHGSAYYYDRHVPIVFLGGTIAPGTSQERAGTIDVAPTLARLAGIPVPRDLDGRSLDALLPR
jgi:predicted AlkP superfamily pyrophosphatase or phosphodiesterase